MKSLVELYKLLIEEYVKTNEQYVGNSLSDLLENGTITKNEYGLILNDFDFNYVNKTQALNYLKQKTALDNKVQFSIYCKCGTHIMNDETIKKQDKYYCPKCNIEIISIGSKPIKQS